MWTLIRTILSCALLLLCPKSQANVLHNVSNSTPASGCLGKMFSAMGIGNQRSKTYESALGNQELHLSDIIESSGAVLHVAGITSRTHRTLISSCLPSMIRQRNPSRVSITPVTSTCPKYSPCSGHGQCELQMHNYVCRCDAGFHGVDCGEDACSPNPCQHGGTFIRQATGDHFACACTLGRTGRLCNSKIDYCRTDPCKHGATCVSREGKAVCHCRIGYQGDVCEERWLTQKFFMSMARNQTKSTKSMLREISEGLHQILQRIDLSHKYKVIGTAMTWDNAKTRCEVQRGRLASIRSNEELFTVLKLNVFTGSGPGIWLGGEDKDGDGKWHWLTGQPIIFDNWAPREPNNRGSENCLQIGDDGYGHAGRYNDVDCNVLMPFLCEFD
eukprot:scpid63803/ scgid7234/ Neurocan core protein; Chondroitin sulfate proteoglycan 3